MTLSDRKNGRMKNDRNITAKKEYQNYNTEDTGRLMTENNSVSKAMIIIVAVLAITALIVAGLAAFTLLGTKSNNDGTVAVPAEQENTTEQNESSYADDNEDLKKMYKAYAEVLERYEYDIRSYNWQDDVGGSSVAIYDISGDGIPELMFFTAESDAISTLHVYTYEDGEARECRYGSGQPVNDSYSEDGRAMFADVNVAAGTNYMIYTGKESGTVYIAYSMGDETMYYYSVKFSYGNDNMILIEHEVENSYGPNDDYTKSLDRYYVNDEEVSGKTGAAEFGMAAEAFSRLLIYSGYISDMTVFEYVKSRTPVAMTYDEAVRFCSY